jgi:putative transposase
VATSLALGVTGPAVGSRKLSSEVEALIAGTLTKWLPRQRELGAPRSDLTMEIRRVCLQAGLPPPSRHTVSRRWADHQEAQAIGDPAGA